MLSCNTRCQKTQIPTASLRFIFAILAVTILLSIIDVGPIALGQSKTSSVSIIKGASNPSTTEPYNLSPLTVSVGTTVVWTNK